MNKAECVKALIGGAHIVRHVGGTNVYIFDEKKMVAFRIQKRTAKAVRNWITSNNFNTMRCYQQIKIGATNGLASLESLYHG